MVRHKDKKKAVVPVISRLAVMAGVTVILYVAALFIPFVHGYAWFPVAAARCGNQPYIANDFASARSYTVPGDGYYDGPNVFTSPDNYYCTQAEAEAAGYHPYVWGSERCKTYEPDGKVVCMDAGNGFLGPVVFLLVLIGLGAGIGYPLSRKLLRPT